MDWWVLMVDFCNCTKCNITEIFCFLLLCYFLIVLTGQRSVTERFGFFFRKTVTLFRTENKLSNNFKRFNSGLSQMFRKLVRGTKRQIKSQLL